MPGQVRTQSVDALSAFRAALIEYADEVRQALSMARHDASRTVSWLRLEQRPRWEAECRRRQELLARARSEVVQRQAMASMDRRTDVDLKKAVDRAQRALQEAEEKAETTRRWTIKLEREESQLEGRLQALSVVVEWQIPQAIAMLEGLTRSLDAYLKTIAPQAEERTDGENKS